MDYHQMAQNAMDRARETFIGFGVLIVLTIVFAGIRHARGRVR